MKAQATFIEFVLRQWLVLASGIGLILTTLYTRHIPFYSTNEFEVLFVLLVLFVAIRGLQRSGFVLWLAQHLERGTAVPLKLVLATFFLSMLVTNDIALVVMVPLTLSLHVNRKDILVILEALAANSGSALTPIGNPQNLYIYWTYNVPPGVFLATIAPFSLLFLGLLSAFSFLVQIETTSHVNHVVRVDGKAFFYGASLIVVLLTIVHVLPLLAGALVVFFALAFDRKSLRIDYALLLTFFFFFGISDNLKTFFGSTIGHSGHIFLLSALASQIMSNVPATLLFSEFTSNWQALLWGSNAGGFGSLFASLANLIAYKAYLSHHSAREGNTFAVKFVALGYVALLVSMGWYFLLLHSGALP